MPRPNDVLIAMLMLGASVTVCAAQPEAPAEVASTDATQEHSKQLSTCREGIVDGDARDVDRRRWAELLFTYTTPEANRLIVELLAPAQDVGVRRTVCEVMESAVGADPSRGVPDFVDPLLDMLGAEQASLRAASAATLAEFPPDQMAPRLGAIAADEQRPMTERMAAIGALARNTHRREVVGQLVALLASESPALRARVIESLEPASLETFGDDAARWQQWWADRQDLTNEQWLDAQLQIYRQRSRRINERFEGFRQRTQRERDSTVEYVSSLQSELFRALPPEQRRSKLVEWLASPVPVVRLTALDLIKARMADEGETPEGGVLQALVRLLRDGEQAERRGALLIVQNVNDRSVVEAVLARLAVETDPGMRLAILSALGRMGDAEAIPALVAELEREQATASMVREAASSLGRIANRVEEKQTLQAALAPLQRRYAEADADDTALRAALLSAMAGIGDRSFAPAFSDAINSDDPRLLQPAIRGLRAVGDRTKLTRIRDLTGNSDPLVRLDAIVAVSELGRDAEDLQSLLIRLNPSIEDNELAREAAWSGFREYMSRRSLAERIDASQRLRDTPDLEARYLGELAETISTTGADPLELERVRDRLATVLIAMNRYAEATGQLRLLFQRQVDRQAENAVATGVRWVDATLRSEPPVDVGDVVRHVADAAESDVDREQVIDTIARYLGALDVASNRTRAASLASELQGVDATGWPPRWDEMLRRLAARIESAGAGPVPEDR